MGVVLTASWLLAPSIAGAERPMMAFVVGIERYDEEHLDRLRYVAENAFEVWETLQRIHPAFDHRRSRLLIADREPAGTTKVPVTSSGSVRVTERITREALTGELERFLNRVRNNTTVVLFLGGHGNIQAGAESYGVSFLPSNFEHEGFLHNVLMEDILRKVRVRLNRRSGVDVVVLANMCHAGALARPGVYDGGRYDIGFAREKAQELTAELTLGAHRLAYIPAVPADEREYESDDDGGSRFVRFLREGLRGAAAEPRTTEITTGRLLRFLQAKLKPPPQSPELFAGDIALGSSGDLEAEQRQALGLVLGAASFDDHHRGRLLDLAGWHFRRASEVSSQHYGQSLVRWIQTLFLHGGEPQLREAHARLARARTQPVVRNDAEAAAAIEELARASEEVTPYYAVLVAPGVAIEDSKWPEEYLRRQTPQLVRELDSWRSGLERVPGLESLIDALPSGEEPQEGVKYPDQLLRWPDALDEVKRWRSAASPTAVLVVIVGGLRTEHELLWKLLRSWQGPGVVVFGNPTGGTVDPPQELAASTSIWLAAQEENGVTFRGEAEKLIAAAVDGLSPERLDRLREEQVESFRPLLGGGDSSHWVVGTTSWRGDPRAPFWRTTPLPVALRQTADWPWRMSVASGERNGSDPAVVEARQALARAGALVASGEWSRMRQKLESHAEVPEVALRLGALAELEGDYAEARQHYRAYLPTVEPAEGSPLARVVKAVRSRADRVAKVDGRLVHLLAIAVGDYVSPMIPDLATAEREIDLWVRFFEHKVGSAELRLHRLSSPSTAKLRTVIEETAEASGPSDLIALVYSGRGFAADGYRYLVAADAVPAVGIGWTPSDRPPFLDQLTLAELSERFWNRDLLAIVDAQFSPPERSHPIYKHALPWLTSEVADNRERSDPPRGEPRYPAPPGRDRHVLFLWEGSLRDGEGYGEAPTNSTHLVLEDSPVTGVSLLTRGLIEAWDGSGPMPTYGAWQSAAAAIASPAPERGRLVLQGTPDRPIFSSGDGVDDLFYLLRQRDLREINLRLVLRAEERHASQLDTTVDRLSRAVLRAELARTLSELPSCAVEARKYLAEARDLLREVGTRLGQALPEDASDGSWLLSNYLYWHSEIVGRQLDEPHTALDILLQRLQQAPERLSDPEILEQLVEVTRLASSRSATATWRSTAEQLTKIGNALPELEAEVERLHQIVQAELEHQTANYPVGYGPVPPNRPRQAVYGIDDRKK